MLGHPCQKADLGEGCRKQHMLQNYTDAIKSEQTPSRNLGTMPCIINTSGI